MAVATIVYNLTPTRLGSLEVECTLSETHQADVDITEHPVEDSAAISDHMRPRQEVVTISGIITGAPTPKEGESTSRSITVPVPKPGLLGLFSGGVGSATIVSNVPEAVVNATIARMEAARDALYRIKNNGELITVVTGLKTYENMGLRSLTFTRKAEAAFYFTAVLVQIETVNLKTTRLRPRVSAPAAKPKENDGKKATSAGPDVDPLRGVGAAIGNAAGRLLQ